MKEKGISAFLITDLLNIHYLTGFTGSNGYLFLSQGISFFFTDFRYQEQSKREVKVDKIKILERNFFEEVPPELKSEKELAFEEHSLTYKAYSQLKKRLPGVKFHPMPDIVSELRMQKDEAEINLIRTASSITDTVFSLILNFIKPGMTEKEVALKIDFLIKEKAELSFPTICASGENAALPHAKPEDKRLKKGETIIIDIGASYQGYASDMTRTIFLGNCSKKAEEIYKIVKDAQECALTNLRAGKKTKEIDALARDYIKDKGYGKFFGHGLGHGVGLAVHEKPTLSPASSETILPNSILTCEPGIYLPGFGGVRIEDLVLVKKDGIEILSKSPKDLITL